MAELSRPDLCIVGAGALAIALARHARRLGASVVVADRGRPEAGDAAETQRRLAALAASAGLAQALRDGERLGLANGEPRIVHKAIAARAGAVAENSAVLESLEHLAAQGIHVVRGAVRFPDQRSVAVGDLQLRPRHIVLATGGVPRLPALPGLDEIDYFTADSIAGNSRKLTHLLVLGGGPEAVALAQIQRRLGAAVTLVPQGPLLPGFDPEAVAILLQALRAEGVTILDGAAAEAVLPRAQGTGVVVAGADGEQTMLDVSHVLVAMGRVPDVAGLDLEKLRLRAAPGSGSVTTGGLGRTANRAVRAVGVAAGVEAWPQALAHGRASLEAALLRAPLRRPGAEPLLVLTAPALAQIGRVPAVGQKLGGVAGVVRASFAENAAAQAGGVAFGMAKAALDARGRIVGASVVGPGAGEIAAMLALAVERGIALADLASLALPHPSLMGVVAALAESAAADRPVSPWVARQRALRRLLPR